MLRDYLEQIKEADLVLVGIGRELQAKRLMDFVTTKSILPALQSAIIRSNSGRFSFFVPVIPDALLHPEGGGYLVEGNGKEGGSMADRFMESRKITQRFVWHRGSL